MDGNVWSFGGNGYGQLGLGHTAIMREPIQIKKISGVTSIACGEKHTICIDNNSNVWGFGENQFGQLGTGTSRDVLAPMNIRKLSNIIQASCGSAFSVFLRSNGKVYIAGTLLERKFLEAKLIEGLQDIVAIAAAEKYALALDEKGFVYSIGSHCSEFGFDIKTKTFGVSLIEEIPTIRAISCGFKHSLMIDDAGRVWGFGSNENIRLGIYYDSNPIAFVQKPRLLPIPDLSEVSFISQGGNHSIIKEDHGNIYVFGNNYKGQLGVEGATDVRPTKLDNKFSNIIGERLRRQKSARK